jgi:hypothetical protein
MLVYFVSIGDILRRFGIFHVLLVILWSFGTFFPILVYCIKKNLATLCCVRVGDAPATENKKKFKTCSLSIPPKRTRSRKLKNNFAFFYPERPAGLKNNYSVCRRSTSHALLTSCTT